MPRGFYALGFVDRGIVTVVTPRRGEDVRFGKGFSPRSQIALLTAAGSRKPTSMSAPFSPSSFLPLLPVCDSLARAALGRSQLKNLIDVPFP